MKKVLCLICILMLANSVFADYYVNDYYRKDGTYVRGYYKNNAPCSGLNNSTRSNYNQYGSQQSGRDPYHNYFFPKNNYYRGQRSNSW